MDRFPDFLSSFQFWLAHNGLKILVILIVAYLIKRFSGRVIEKFIRRAIVADKFLSPEAEKKREDTLIQISANALGVVIWLTVALIVLSELGISIGPLLTTAGIAGLALGFGGQYVIRDLISGLFIILENQYRVGDVVCFGEICGTVEDITMRLTTLRDLDGRVHHVPHGEIKTVSNLAKDFGRINIDIGLAYNTDLEKALSLIDKVGQELAADPGWQDRVTKPPQALGVNEFADSAIIIKILGETKPLKQWEVAREFRRRLKTALDRAGMEIPFPQRVVHQT
jgi:small-conductance mechanosensitive channel